MSTVTVFLCVLNTLNTIVGVLALAAIGRLQKNHNDAADALIRGHNWTANRLRELSELISSGINAVASFTAGKSTQGGSESV